MIKNIEPSTSTITPRYDFLTRGILTEKKKPIPNIVVHSLFGQYLKLIRKTIKLVFVASPLSMYHQRVRAKTAWFGIRIMCLSGVTSTVKCCFSELALHA
jgi:hypothetical protein